MQFDFNTINITKDFLLEKNSQETYMEHYLGVPVSKKLIKSPLRTDDKPTCAFYKNKNGDLYFKDFATKDHLNFIGVVQEKFNCSYYKAVKIIANDFELVKFENLKKNEKIIEYSNNIMDSSGSVAAIQITEQDFTEDEIKWWMSYGITKKTLKKFRVYSCKNVFLNGNYLTSNSNKDFVFGYYKGINSNKDELWRIYFPNRKTYRFLSNWDAKMIQGSKQLPKEGDLLVITKSLKDVMCLYEFGITAIAPNSETLFLTEAQLKKIKSKFKKVIVFYDNDLAGISNMNKIRKEFDVEYVYIPRKYKSKDISDFYKKYGRDKTQILIDEYKQHLDGK